MLTDVPLELFVGRGGSRSSSRSGVASLALEKLGRAGTFTDVLPLFPLFLDFFPRI